MTPNTLRARFVQGIKSSAARKNEYEAQYVIRTGRYYLNHYIVHGNPSTIIHSFGFSISTYFKFQH